jgi:hypothetical protein
MAQRGEKLRLKTDGGWLQVRENSTYRNDTLTDRIMA